MKVQMWYCCKISLRAMKMTFSKYEVLIYVP
jgi:hypothetical protein